MQRVIFTSGDDRRVDGVGNQDEKSFSDRTFKKFLSNLAAVSFSPSVDKVRNVKAHRCDVFQWNRNESFKCAFPPFSILRGFRMLHLSVLSEMCANKQTGSGKV